MHPEEDNNAQGERRPDGGDASAPAGPQNADAAAPRPGEPVTIRFAEYEELKTLARERDEYLKRLQRAVANSMSLQQRQGKMRQAAEQEALRTVARKVLPLADSLARALEVAQQTEGAEQITEGLRITEREFYAILQELGIEPIQAVGRPFDPAYHEAVFQQPAQGVEPNTVVQEIKKGFLLNGDLLRPAQVSVAGPPGEGPQAQ